MSSESTGAKRSFGVFSSCVVQTTLRGYWRRPTPASTRHCKNICDLCSLTLKLFGAEWYLSVVHSKSHFSIARVVVLIVHVSRLARRLVEEKRLFKVLRGSEATEGRIRVKLSNESIAVIVACLSDFCIQVAAVKAGKRKLAGRLAKIFLVWIFLSSAIFKISKI